ncbi:MAG: hypothetical protein E6Q97_09460 [Desulfurellales bacterium]|nr:MAG: hypothetical protein E6Q97_09460 [Desulfurellales bacterium]
MNLKERFAAVDDEYLAFEKIAEPEHRRPDVCAFLLLDRLAPGDGDMVSASEHDEIFLETSPDELNAAASDEDILTLIRCGVRYDSENDCLAMFV